VANIVDVVKSKWRVALPIVALVSIMNAEARAQAATNVVTTSATTNAAANMLTATTYSNEIERAMVRTLEILADGGLKPAMKELDAALVKNPNFRLGHLMRGDLLMAKSGVAVALSGAPGVKQPPDAATHIANMRHEAQVRLNRYFDAPVANALPTALLQLAPQYEHALLIDMGRSRIYVFKNVDGKPQRIADFYATIGKRGMEKEREGDQKTPIGVYHITSAVAKEKLTDFYGPGAFPINFPNDVDKRLGRSGSGIWIHGTPSDTYSRAPWASDGCVVLTNDDFVRLSQYIVPGLTPVIISPMVEWQTQPEWTAFNGAFDNYLTQWKSDWESLNMDKYLSHYSVKFDAEGKDINEWSTHKRRVNAGKNFVQVEISNISVFEYATVANQAPMMMVTFDQTYKSSNNNSKMKKRQFWQREDGKWKIIFEGAAS
jgi:murein L,D-transpeptidase YafK